MEDWRLLICLLAILASFLPARLTGDPESPRRRGVEGIRPRTGKGCRESRPKTFGYYRDLAAVSVAA
ncbi:MAG: hypothetical protein ACOY40_15455 [Bacillota bacterium]